MGNSLDKYLKDPEVNKLRPQFSKLELYMLALIFRDLSARQHGIIDKETFLQFFPLTGLWGERLFEKFDLKHTGNLDFYEFVRGIGSCCHSSEDEKIHLLFSLYDMDQDGFIKKKEMITMLYNYPKNHIKFITDEMAPDGGERLEKLTEAKRQSIQNLDGDHDAGHQNHAHARGSLIAPSVQSVHSDHVDGALNDELVVAEEKAELSGLMIERDIKQSFAFYTEKEETARQLRDRQAHGDWDHINNRNSGKKNAPLLEAPSASPKKNSGANMGNSSIHDVNAEGYDRKASNDKVPSRYSHERISNTGLTSRRKQSSSSTVFMDQQSFVISTTVNTRVKEYASFMFKTFDGANSRGKISYEEFKQWLSMHPVILKVFDDTFRQELWSTQHSSQDKTKQTFTTVGNESPRGDNGARTPREKDGPTLKYREKPAEFAGYLVKKGKKTKSWKKRYFELEDHFLIYYEKKEDKYPKGVMFLEGCYIEETKDYPTTHKYGFVITHKSDSYEPHYLYCNDKSQFDEWMRHLRVFQSSSIMDMYAFQEKIGTGKFSVVFRAVTKDSKKNEYAVKVIDKKSLKPEEKEFLLSETSVMKILDHPSMIKLIDTIETRTHIYIVTEIVKDGDLFDYITTREYLEEHEASLIMKKLLTSIDYLHSTGIIHRDIKPENILITLGSNEEIKELKIIDFGFAKLVNESVKITETCGTPNYVAPEVLKGCGYDKGADIWSLGSIMYLMIRGLLPFDDLDVNTVLKNTLKAEVCFEDDHWRNVSPEAKDLVAKFLHKDPLQRIEVKEALLHPWIKNRDKLKTYEGINRRKGSNDSQ